MWIADTLGGDALISVDDLPEDAAVVVDENEECCTAPGIVGGVVLDGTTGGGGGGGGREGRWAGYRGGDTGRRGWCRADGDRVQGREEGAGDRRAVLDYDFCMRGHLPRVAPWGGGTTANIAFEVRVHLLLAFSY